MKKTEKQKKADEYAFKIIKAITEVFNEDSDFYIDKSKLEEGENLTHFSHALSNVAPAYVYRLLTGDEVNGLEFNHIANRLCFQYSNKNK